MPKLPKLCNKPFAELGSDFLEAWRAGEGCKQYVAHLVRRGQARASARRVLEDAYAMDVGEMNGMILHRKGLMAGHGSDTSQLADFAGNFEDHVGLPAASLADRSQAVWDMPTVRQMVAGTEFVLHVGSEDSLHDFYVEARKALGLDPKGCVSLALLRTGDGTFMMTREQRTLGCGRDTLAMRYVKGKVFEAYCHA